MRDIYRKRNYDRLYQERRRRSMPDAERRQKAREASAKRRARWRANGINSRNKPYVKPPKSVTSTNRT